MYKAVVRDTTSPSAASESRYGVPAIPCQQERAYSRDRCVPELVAHQAAQNPDRIALLDDSRQLTYSELDALANRLAHRLQGLGVSSGIPVAVCMSRSPLTAAAALAVMKAGGAYLPLDPNYPRERLSFILADASIRVVLSESTVAGQLPEGNWRLILLDRDAEAIGKFPAEAPPSHICPEHLSYVIYTSGSTGTPKGVEITHDSLLNLVFWHQKAFAITSDDRATQFASFGFDAAVWELWPYLTAGATVYITPEEVRSSAELLKDWLVAREITISFVPTALAERLIMLDWPANTKLRLLLTGADTLHHFPRPGLPFTLINNYGPTEATVVATSGPVVSEAHPGRRPPIGRPIDNATVYIVDESLGSVPMGEIGELCIGGAGVAKGYVNSPELTATKFVPDPFTNKSGARLYRTGDLARWLPDGQIEYVGRVDNLIKIRGYRIEPNEIVSILNTHPAVQASAVTAREDGTGNLRLLAYVVMHQGQDSPAAGELRDLLRARLPDYMVPAGFLQLPDLPLTPNGKLDRDALPAPDDSNTLPDENYVSPRTVLEERLSLLVAELLGVDRVGINDNFFLIGGHSLFGTQLIARIRGNFGVDLPLRSIFESPTPAQLAQQIESLMVTQIDALTEDEVQHALEQASPGGEQQ
jgi:amino acid adenylation domain-containing protein